MNSRLLLYISAIILVLPVLFSPQYLNESTPRFGPDDDDDSDGVINSEDRYPNATVVLEMLDITRSRGAEPYEQNITLAMELAAMLWSDSDGDGWACLLYTSPSPRDQRGSRMPSSA